jgi:hypothetical protein
LKKNIIWGRKILEIRRKGIRKNAAVDPEPGRMASHCHCQFTGVYNRGFVLSLDTPASVYMYTCPEAEFLDVIGTKVFLLAIHSHLYYGVFPPSPT